MKSTSNNKLRHLSASIFCPSIVISVIGLSSCTSSSAIQSMKTQSVYDRVIQSGKIRAAYCVYPPYCMKDPTSGKISGIGPEALELIAKKLGMEVQYTEEVGWGNMVEGLQTNRYDTVAMPVWTNPNRARMAWFSKPLSFNPAFAYMRKGDQRFKHIEDLNSPNVTITTVDGTTEGVIAQSDFPKAKRLTMPQLTDVAQSFLNVSTKKADIVIGEPGLAGRFMQNNPGTLEIIKSSPLRIYPDCWLLKRGESEFKAMIDTVLDEVINSGQMDRIIHKYEKNPFAIFSVAKPYRLDNN